MKNFTKEELLTIFNKYVGTPVRIYGMDAIDLAKKDLQEYDKGYSCYLYNRKTNEIIVKYTKQIDEQHSQTVVVCYVTFKKVKARNSEPKYDYKSFDVDFLLGTTDIDAAIAKKEEERAKIKAQNEFNEAQAQNLIKRLCQELNIKVIQAQQICGVASRMFIPYWEEDKYYAKN